MPSPRLQELGVQPLELKDVEELQALIEANRERLARWLPWAAAQDLAATEHFIAEAERQLAGNDGFQAKVAPEGEIVGTMTVVVDALVEFAFSAWKLHRLEIHCAPGNHRSRAIGSAIARLHRRSLGW